MSATSSLTHITPTKMKNALQHSSSLISSSSPINSPTASSNDVLNFVSTFGFRERIVAAESLSFLVEVLLSVQPMLVVLLASSNLQSFANNASSSSSSTESSSASESNSLSKIFQMVQTPAAQCETVMVELVPVAIELQHLIHRSTSKLLIRAGHLCRAITSHPKFQESSRAAAAAANKNNKEDYTDWALQDCTKAWNDLCHGKTRWVTPYKVRIYGFKTGSPPTYIFLCVLLFYNAMFVFIFYLCFFFLS
jgi:hypothetical protein